MAGKKFLNPYVKVVLCSLGAAFMGYYLYRDVQAGELYVGAPLMRAVALVAFVYLLVKSLLDLMGRRGEDNET